MSLQRVFSNAGLTDFSAPQGSFSGPLLYTSDFTKALKKAGFYPYAENTCIFYRDKCVKVRFSI